MRARAATLIRQIKADVRAGSCQSAQRKLDALVPLIGSRGLATQAKVKPKTVARLWGLVGTCRFRGRGFGDGEAPKPAPAAAVTAATPVVKQVAGWWPFGKKKVVVVPKRRAGDKTIMWIPQEKGRGTAMTKRGHGMMGARRRRRRRR